MREIEHADLFKPPAGVKVVVIPVVGEFWDSGLTKTTPMKTGYAAIAVSKWKKIAINVGILQWRMGVTPHPLTISEEGTKRIWFPGKQGSLPLSYHLVTLPTRRFKEQPITVDFLTTQLRQLRALCDDKIPWLKQGDVALPQICDADKPWSYWKSHVELWLPGDRYVVLSGKPGTIT